MLSVKEPTIADSEGLKAIFFDKQLEEFASTIPPEFLKAMKGMGIDVNSVLKDMEGYNNDDILKNYVDDFLSKRNRCLILKDSGKIIGYCLASAEISSHFGKLIRIIGIGELYIAKGYRNKGLGSSLLKAFVKIVKEKEECSVATLLDEKQYKPVNVKLFEHNGLF